MSEKSFLQYFQEISKFERFDNTSTMYPTQMYRFVPGKTKMNNFTSTFYGYIYSGNFELNYKQSYHRLSQGSFFVFPSTAELNGNGEVIIIERFGYRGLFQIGLLEEDKGRLCYIDNASTTILAHAARLGDPCLNLLTFPPHIVQSTHIHPTVRLGIVLKGAGECIINNKIKVPLLPGIAFNLTEGMQHSFNSFENGLHVLAFHPDTDTGPTDHSHPMLNRTYLTKTHG